MIPTPKAESLNAIGKILGGREPLLCRTATRGSAVAVELAALEQRRAHG